MPSQNVISLPIPANTRQMKLEDRLDFFTMAEVLEGDEQAYCSSSVKSTRGVRRASDNPEIPANTGGALKRFSATGRYRGKIDCMVEYPLGDLNLSPYSKTQGISNYNLYGVVNHAGTLTSGHYMAYCRHPYSGQQWHEFNDTRAVHPVSQIRAVSSQAYLLFYEQDLHIDKA